LIPGFLPVLRGDGELKPIQDEETLTEDFVLNLSKELMTEGQAARLEKNRELFFTREISSLGRFRVRVYYQKGSLSLNFKFVESQIPVLTELGLPSRVENLRHLHRGLVLISGPYDSGRSYLVASLLQSINKERAVRIMTLESSIEFVLTGDKAIIEQRELGRDLADLAEGLNVLSNEDVDVVYVTDVADGEVAKQLVRLALAGKLVIGVMTSDSAVRTLESYVSLAGGHDMERHLANELADALQAVINMRLVRRSGGAGRLYAAELLLSTVNTKIAIKELDFERLESVLNAGQEEGMQVLDQHLLKLVQDGQISTKEALQAAQKSAWGSRISS